VLELLEMAEIKIHLPAAAHIESWPTIARESSLCHRRRRCVIENSNRAPAIIYADDVPPSNLDCIFRWDARIDAKKVLKLQFDYRLIPNKSLSG